MQPSVVNHYCDDCDDCDDDDDCCDDCNGFHECHWTTATALNNHNYASIREREH